MRNAWKVVYDNRERGKIRNLGSVIARGRVAYRPEIIQQCVLRHQRHEITRREHNDIVSTIIMSLSVNRALRWSYLLAEKNSFPNGRGACPHNYGKVRVARVIQCMPHGPHGERSLLVSQVCRFAIRALKDEPSYPGCRKPML